jgi:hypothetical protein
MYTDPANEILEVDGVKFQIVAVVLSILLFTYLFSPPWVHRAYGSVFLTNVKYQTVIAVP